MLCVKRIAHRLGDLHRELRHIEGLGLAALGGVYDIVLRALRGLPAVPELVAVPEPVGGDLRGEHHLADLLGRESFRQSVVGFLLCGSERAQEQRCGQQCDFTLHNML
jgi:hypothetical protein